MGEDTEGMVESTSKLRDLVKGFTGFDIMEDEKTFKSIYDIILGIGEKWNELNDIDRAALLEALAGKRAGNALAAALNNIDDLKASYETALNASGSAMREQENYEKSIQFSIDRLKATAQDLAQDFMSSDLIKNTIDFLNTVLELLDGIVEKTGDLTPFLTAVSGIFAASKIGKGMSGIADLIGGLTGGQKDKKSILSSIGSAFKKYKAEKMLNNIDKADMEILENSMYGVEVSADKATTGLKKFFKTSENGTSIVGKLATSLGISSGALVGIIAAAGAAAYAIYKLSTAQSEINERAKETYDTYSEDTTSLKEYQDRVEELRKITDDSTKSIEEQQAAREELLTIQSEMVDKFGLEAGKIDILRDSVDSLTASFETLNNEAYQEFKNNLNDTGWWEDRFLSLAGYEDALDSIKSQMEQSSYTLGLFGESAAKSLEEAFEAYKISGQIINEIDSTTGAETGSYFVQLDEGSLEANYKAILNLQKEFENGFIGDALKEQALTIKNTLEEISDSYNTYLEQEVIFPNYGEQVSKIRSIMSDLHNAQVKNDEEETDRLSKELAEAYEAVYQNGEIDQASKDWFSNLISEYQGIIDRQEFIMKIKPEIATDVSEEYQRRMEQLKDTGLSQNEIMQKIDIASGHSDKGLSDMGWDEETIELIRYLQRLVDENPISLSFILDDAKVSKLSQDTMRILGDAYEELTAEQKAVIGSISENDIIEEVNAMRILGHGANSAKDALHSLLEESKKVNSEVTFTSTIDKLSDLEKQMSLVDTAFSKLFDSDKETVDLDSIKALKDGLAEAGVNVEDLSKEFDELYNAQSGEEAQNAVNSLADAFLRQSHVLDDLNESNKSLIQSELERMGISNAQEIVENALLNAEAKAIVSKYDLANATSKDTEKLLEEIGAADGVKASLIAAEAAEVLFANTSLNANQKVEELRRIASAAWGAAAALEFSQLTDNRGYDHSFSLDPDKAWEQIEKKYSQRANAIVLPEFTGGKATNSAKESAAKDAGSAAKDAAEQFDWLETKIQRCEEEIQRLDKTVSATYKSWSKRNGAIASELDKVREKIALQTTAYEVYMAKANSIALDQHYKDLVMNGGLFIEDIADENLKKLIQDFKQWYEKAIQAKDAIDDLNASLANLAKQKFDNVKSEFEGFTSEIEHFVNMIDKELSHVEAMGKIAGKSFYEEKINKDAEQLEKLKKEREALVNALEEAESNGIEKGSADWIAMRNDIYSVDEKIQELTYDMEELKQKIIEVNKLKFDDIKRQFDGYLSNIQHFRNMIDKEMSHVENMGGIAGKSFYRAEIKQNDKELEALKVERKKLMKQLEEAEKDGLEKGSPEWLEMRDAIYAIDEQIVDVKYETEELKKKMKEVSKLRFDDFKAQFEQVTQIIQNQVNSVNSVISLVEKSGHIVSTKYYENLIKLNKQNISTLHKEYNKLQKQLTKAMEKGDVKKYSNEW